MKISLRDLNLIKSATRIWEEISEINNVQVEFHKLNGVVPVLLIRDIYKYPDKVHEFMKTLDYWETKDFDTNSIVRPGLTHAFTEPLYPWLAKGPTSIFEKIFGVSQLKVMDIYVQATGGDMTLDPTGGLCCYPHVDCDVFDNMVEAEYPDPVFVANINLTKSVDPVTTGFWSYRDKYSFLDFTRQDKNSIIDFYNRHEDQTIDQWFQIRDYEGFKFETSADMMYNSLVVYSTGYIHNPYIMPEWFKDDHRLMMSIFYNLNPQHLDFEERDVDNVCAAWEHFRLDTLFNYHPRQTAPQF
jgi:hypothetical protein